MNEQREMTEKEQLEKGAQELEAIAARLNAMNINNRIMSIVKTKIEEAALWYAKLLRSED